MDSMLRYWTIRQICDEKWRQGREKFGPEFIGDPAEEAVGECADLINYLREWDRRGKVRTRFLAFVVVLVAQRIQRKAQAELVGRARPACMRLGALALLSAAMSVAAIAVGAWILLKGLM
jgi:hypothetical protein